MPDEPTEEFDLLTFLTQGVVGPKDVPIADVPRLVVDDWTFLKEGLAEVVVDPKHELDLVIDEGRRFAAFNPPRDLKARLQLLPDEVLRERRIADRLKLTADKDEAEEKLREAREHDRSDSMWPEVGWLGAHHPVFDWLVDKLLVRFGRNEAPVLQAKVSAPTYLVQTMFANKRGQPTIVEWLAIDNVGNRHQRIRPMFDVLKDAGVGPAMPNPGGVDPSQLRGLQRDIKDIVKVAEAKAKLIRDERREELDGRVRDELVRVGAWKEEALFVSDSPRGRERVERTYIDLSTYIESLRTDGNPYVRVVGVLVPLGAAPSDGRV